MINFLCKFESVKLVVDWWPGDLGGGAHLHHQGGMDDK